MGVVGAAAGAVAVVTESGSPIRGWPPRPRRGLGWRPEIASVATQAVASGLIGFVEVIAEDATALDPTQVSVPVIPHGVGLSLGSADPTDLGPVSVLGEAASRFGSPLVSEHLAFVRAGGWSAGHLLPVPRTPLGVEVLVANIATVSAQLPVPLAVELPAVLVTWPEDTLSDAQFVTEVLSRCEALLLLDIANVYANAVNAGREPVTDLRGFPLERIAYCHLAGGRWVDGVYLDTHTDPVPDEVFALAAELPGVPMMIERDGEYPTPQALLAEVSRLP